ncbi:MAG: hypothetical protein DBX40_06680 [Clostridiales bacterium]|nr:MAG: hypothetical protein DBX40_06680 [Clostridiales bacterium]
MKLLTCHIENFGNLTQTDYTFNDNITEFCEQNGYGKTTFAAFIKAMFYGLPSYRTNAKEFPDRKHYYPFSGGKFGGSLTFEMHNDEYRIERFFGKKNEKEDTLAVYRNNKYFSDFGDDIGKAVFGLDQESFERTAFVNSDAIDICATGSISAKLNNFVTDIESNNTIDSVISAIEKPKKELKADRGDNGLLKTTRQEILDLTDTIKNLEKMERSLEERYAESRELKQSIWRQETEIKEIKDRNILIERWQEYENKSARKSDIQRALEVYTERFPHGIPTEDQIAEIKNQSHRIATLKGRQATTIFAENKQRELDRLSTIFSDGIPNEKYLHDLKSDIERITASTAKLDVMIAQEPPEHLDELCAKFEKHAPADSEIDAIEKSVERYKTLENRHKAQSDIVMDGKISKSNAHIFTLIAIFAIIIVACGIGFLFVNVIVGGILLGVGSLMLLTVGFLYLRNLSLNRQTVVIDDSTVKLQTEMRQIESTVREFLTKFGYYSPNGIVFDFEIFKKDLKEYLQLIKKSANKDNDIQKQRQIIETETAQVKNIFRQYDITDDNLQNAYIKLQNMVNAITSLQQDSENNKKNEHATVKEIAECETSILTTLSNYDIALSENLSAQIEDFTTTLNETTRLRNDLVKIDAEISEYKAKYGLEEKPAQDIVDTRDMEASLTQMRQELAMLESNISSDESEVENLDDARNRLENLTEKLQHYQEKYKILSATIKFLRTAEQNMKDKYIAPIRDNFLYFADKIETTLGEKICMDQNFNILFERNGENRSDRHLSAGQRSVCALCFRLALVNNMYENEKPFIVMDDPFVHLDENHMEKTRKTMKELSRDNQIIYFSCHNSRKLLT